jgi:hypothetical protein
LKTTRYFEEQVLRKRPYIARLVSERDRNPHPPRCSGRRAYPPLGRNRVPGEPRRRYLRVVTLGDGETVHNAFFDRNFREDER